MTFYRAILFWCCILCAIPLVRAEEDPNFVRGNALYQHGKGNPADFPEAFQHFMKAAERKHARSQFYVGRMYDLESSVGIDLKAAKKWYRLAGENGDATAWNNLGCIYHQSGEPNDLILECFTRAAELGNSMSYFNLGKAYRFGKFGLQMDMDKAISHLEKAMELHHPLAGRMIGVIYFHGEESVKADKAKAAYYYSLAAKEGDDWSTIWLRDLLKDGEVKKHYDAATLQEWKTLCKDHEKKINEEVQPVLAKTRVAYDEGNSEAARQILAKAMKQWVGDGDDPCHWPYTHVIWTEAQLKSGRADILWSQFLYRYLCDFHEQQKDDEKLLATRVNLNGGFSSLGQFGLLRQSKEVDKRLILQLDKVDVDATLTGAKVGPDYQILGAEKLPLFANYEDGQRASTGEFIGVNTMSSLTNLASERLAVGGWESALILAEWTQRWSDAFRKAGVTPQRSYPGFEGEFAQLPMKIRMDAFSALGLPEREAEAARQIVALNSDSYGGRKLHYAQLRLFDLAVAEGRSHEIKLKELEDLEEKIRRNILDFGHTWKFAKLVRAKVIAKTRGLNEGLPLVREVLEETNDDVIAPLRLEALLVAAQLSLDAGVTAGVNEYLSEALESARSRGMLIKEIQVYECYIAYLLATHQYDVAVEMQNRVIDLIKGLRLTPRLKAALSRLDEIVSLRKKNLASAATKGDSDSESTSQQNQTTPDGNRSDGSPTPQNPVMTKSLLTLQPKGIRTLPIGDEASAVFLLSNLSSNPAKATLRFKSDQFHFTRDEPLDGQVTVDCKLQGDEDSRALDCQAEVPGGGQLPIVLIAEGIASMAEGTVSISLSGDSATGQESTWLIQQKAEAGVTAILDAARLTESNFFLVPVFHQLASSETGRKAALRIIAKEPTRVEGFAADGTLLFVDAEGNGSFGDAGDLIATEEMDKLSPVLKSGLESGKFALRYRPHAKSLSQQMEVRIETRELGEGKTWKLDAVDLLEP